MRRALLTCAALAAATTQALAQPTKNFLWQGNVPIPDNGVPHAPVTITVPADPNGLDIVADLNVDAIIQHTWQGNLSVTITSPAGTSVRVMDRPGFSGTGFGFSNDNLGNPSTGSPFVWDDESTRAPYDSGTAGAPANSPTGSWRPELPLGAFHGESKVGVWRCRVEDWAPGDVGTILRFSLEFTNVPEPATLGLLTIAAIAARRR
ncbi:Proprotein convertase P-domain protein [Phycisphaerae bacterium RAS1]|nr:Proprotein convertase P-domain protein [Phycisphaerae bacterium RAS1]